MLFRKTNDRSGIRRISSSLHLILFAVVYGGMLGDGFAQDTGTEGESLLFRGDESAYLNRIDSMRNDKGLYLDRRSDPGVVSTAATGLGVLALAEATSRGLRDYSETTKVVRCAFEQTVKSNSERNRGWLSHFTDASGSPKESSEISTIDTAIFYSGLLQASRLLKDQDLEAEIRESLNRIDVPFVIRNGIFLHGFYWNAANIQTSNVTTPLDKNEGSDTPQFIPHLWNDSSEGVILYHLFGLPFPMQITRTDYPLFVYAYPLCFFDDPVYDQFLREAIEGQIAKLGYWGVTATDGPKGYVTFDSEVISPVLIGGIATKYPKYLEPLKSMKIEATSGSMHLPSGWKSSDDLTIDLSSAYILFSRWSRQMIDLEKAIHTLPENLPPEAEPIKRVDAVAT